VNVEKHMLKIVGHAYGHNINWDMDWVHVHVLVPVNVRVYVMLTHTYKAKIDYCHELVISSKLGKIRLD
jgi:hypothetical protein